MPLSENLLNELQKRLREELQIPPSVLFDNDFSQGLEGWSGLITTGENYYPSLSPVSIAGPYSMILETMGAALNIEARASKRLHAFRGRVRWWTRFAWNADVASYLRYLRFMVDWQSARDERRWFGIRYCHWGEAGAAIAARWTVVNDPAFDYTTITELEGYELGMNTPFKYDFHDIIIEFDTINHRYISVEIDGRLVDLSGYGAPSSDTPEGDFANGSNFLFFAQSRSDQADSNPKLYIDRTRAEVL